MSAARCVSGTPPRPTGGDRQCAIAQRRAPPGSVRSVAQQRRLAGRLAVDQTIRAGRIELHHPIADDLQRDPTDPRRFGACRAVIDSCKRQQTTGLRCILAPSRRHPKPGSIKINPKRKRHGEPPSFARYRITPEPRRGIPRSCPRSWCRRRLTGLPEGPSRVWRRQASQWPSRWPWVGLGCETQLSPEDDHDDR